MGISDNAAQVRAHGWRTLASLHNVIESRLEQALRPHNLSVVEHTVLDALARQDGWHLRMAQLARAAALSPSATTRLVNRLEERGLLVRVVCAEDRRGLYTELTPAGHALLEAASPDHARALASALAEAREVPELVTLVDVVEILGADER